MPLPPYNCLFLASRIGTYVSGKVTKSGKQGAPMRSAAQKLHLQVMVEMKPEIMGPRRGGIVVANINQDTASPRWWGSS